jgi:hypothetical protein
MKNVRVEFDPAVRGAHEDQWWVSNRGKQCGGKQFFPLYFVTEKDAERYAAGLRAELDSATAQRRDDA